MNELKEVFVTSYKTYKLSTLPPSLAGVKLEILREKLLKEVVVCEGVPIRPIWGDYLPVTNTDKLPIGL